MTRTTFLVRAVFFGVLLASDVCQGKLGGEQRELQQHDEPQQQQRELLSLKNLGAEPPTPLQRCQGDCDTDSDCASGLKCFQRNGGETVPGCDGKDGSRTDYCYSASSGSPSGPAPSPVSAPTPTGGSPTGGRVFRLKLYWEQGYTWQEDPNETFWCLECRGGSCDDGDSIFVNECDSGNQYFTFRTVSGKGYMIELDGGQLCMERKSPRAVLIKKCDSGNSKQWWTGSLESSKFEISPFSAGSLCQTQRHHPKDDEILALEPCTTARIGDTSYWVKW